MLADRQAQDLVGLLKLDAEQDDVVVHLLFLEDLEALILLRQSGLCLHTGDKQYTGGGMSF